MATRLTEKNTRPRSHNDSLKIKEELDYWRNKMQEYREYFDSVPISQIQDRIQTDIVRIGKVEKPQITVIQTKERIYKTNVDMFRDVAIALDNIDFLENRYSEAKETEKRKGFDESPLQKILGTKKKKAHE